ncbi:hypothetical protein [Corallococcus aberystwythensis]|uniref:Cys-rich protein n=1 Tax=Corallococcus aberystwythensis TaxID=2316722 RepID=A0A3A8PP10_9BACT|nr:hypothetical protein [Corallococcus aberystwythensis]RKH56441.1 hypothetical protein D7W81_33800 [Corallococcus aberystwythensis]
MMKRFTMTVLGLGAASLLWAMPASAESPLARCERRCSADKVLAEKTCKQYAKNGAPQCIQATAKVKEKCLKSCQEKAAGKRSSGGSEATP